MFPAQKSFFSKKRYLVFWMFRVGCAATPERGNASSFHIFKTSVERRIIFKFPVVKEKKNFSQISLSHINHIKKMNEEKRGLGGLHLKVFILWRQGLLMPPLLLYNAAK